MMGVTRVLSFLLVLMSVSCIYGKTRVDSFGRCALTTGHCLQVASDSRSSQNWITGERPTTPFVIYRSTNVKAGVERNPTVQLLRSGNCFSSALYPLVTLLLVLERIITLFGGDVTNRLSRSFVVNPLAPVQETVCLLQNDTTASNPTSPPQKAVSSYYMVKLNIRSGESSVALFPESRPLNAVSLWSMADRRAKIRLAFVACLYCRHFRLS